MTVESFTDMILQAYRGRGYTDRPQKKFIRRLIQTKFRDWTEQSNDLTFNLTTDGTTREFELPESVNRVLEIYIDGAKAAKVDPEERNEADAEA